MSNSCIVKQFEHYARLSDEEVSLLESLENNTRQVDADYLIRAANGKAEQFYTLKSGWAMSYQELAQGNRQVLDIYLPGQVMGLRDIGFGRSLTTLATLTEAEVCPFPKRRLSEVFERSSRLCDLFFLIMAREQAVLVERIVNLGRRSAVQKLAHFVVEIQVRLKYTNPDLQGYFRLPLTQPVLGDALGLSAVHVSRSFSKLKQDGLIKTDGNRVQILDQEKLRRLADFNPAYLDEDTSWVRD